MKKIIFAIFAHPDDESFGPSGTLLLEARNGTEVHLITLTDGAGGMNPDNLENLGEVRLKEWRTAGALIGATSMHHLGYQDGKLTNEDAVTVQKQISNLITLILNEQAEDCAVEFMTNDLNGISGHIDHIVAARAACYVFYKLKQNDKRFARIRLACIPLSASPDINTDWLFMEPGRTPEEIDEVVDARIVQNEVTTIIRTHHTQRGDGEQHIKNRGDNLGIDYFIVKT